MQYLSDNDLEFLNHKKKSLLYLAGENIFKQGAFAPYVMFINSGLVKVYLQTGHKKQVNLRIAQEGDFLAFSSVFGEDAYTYSAIALCDAEICMIEKEQLKQLLFKNNEFAMRITSENFKKEKHLLQIITDISYKQMRGKLAGAIQYLSGKEFEAHDIFLHLTRQDLADFASISTESAIKFLKEFEKESIIKLSGKQIQVIDDEKLNEISKNG